MSGRGRLAGWIAIAVVVVVALTVGVVQGREPRTEQGRADAIAKTVKCPVCTSESVYESRSLSAEDIRREILVGVRDGRSADEIRADLVASYGRDILLTPPSDGVGGLVWALPVVGLIAAAGGLTVAFRRWRRAGGTPDPTDSDRELVARARGS